MCGINGFNFNDEKLIREMLEETKHRGPDDSGIYLDDKVSLGHNRLSIIDLSQTGHQPMVSQDGNYVIVFNGELYNFQNIKKKLEKKGRKFASSSDTEVVLQAYEEYKENCLDMFNGIFAFAIWDKKKQELFLARDHFGVKPLFYFFDGKLIVFSSEIKAILKHNIKREINSTALNLYFRLLYIKGPDTIWKNIYKLQPAHFLKIKNSKLEIKKYWQINNFTKLHNQSEIQSELQKLLKASVKRQMIADVEIGVFLSGGIDSTIILSLMSEMSNSRIKTFSVGFEVPASNRERFNQDAFFAKKSAKYFNTEHTEIFVNEKDVAENIEKVVWHMDELVYSPTQVANLLIAKLASKKVKVVLGGDGGDELFGGYRRYYYYNLYEKWHRLPGLFKKNLALKKFFSLFKKGEAYKRLGYSTFDLYWSLLGQKENAISKFLNPQIINLEQCQDYFIKSSNFSKVNGIDLANKMMQLDLETWLVDYSLTRTDKMSMANGLEQRVPLLDKHLVEFAYRIPYKYKMNTANQGKKIFKEAFRQYLPEFIYNKRKSGWFAPMASWLRHGLKDFAYDIISENYNPSASQFINFKEARKILDQHISGNKYELNAIWSIINFQIWHKQFNK